MASELGQKGIFLKDFVERQAVQLPKMKAEQGHGALARAGSLVELWSSQKVLDSLVPGEKQGAVHGGLRTTMGFCT